METLSKRLNKEINEKELIEVRKSFTVSASGAGAKYLYNEGRKEFYLISQLTNGTTVAVTDNGGGLLAKEVKL